MCIILFNLFTHSTNIIEHSLVPNIVLDLGYSKEFNRHNPLYYGNGYIIGQVVINAMKRNQTRLNGCGECLWVGVLLIYYRVTRESISSRMTAIFWAKLFLGIGYSRRSEHF